MLKLAAGTIFWLAAPLFGQSSVPYAAEIGSLFSDGSFDDSYPGEYRSIRSVDFRNFTLRFIDKDGKPTGTARLRNGKYERKETLQFESIELESLYYLSPEYALVVYSFFSAGGSSNTNGVAMLFSVSNRRLRQTQELNWDEHFATQAPFYSFDPMTKTFVVRSSPLSAWRRPLLCLGCRRHYFALGWNSLHQTELRTELSDYGKSETKKLVTVDPCTPITESPSAPRARKP